MQKAKNGLILVEFVKSWRVYGRGQGAGFDEKEAARLVSQGIARYKGDSPQKQPKPAPKKDATDKTDEDPLADLPEDWKTSVHGNKLVAIAKGLTDQPVLNKDDAVAVIDGEIEKNKGDQ